MMSIFPISKNGPLHCMMMVRKRKNLLLNFQPFDIQKVLTIVDKSRQKCTPLHDKLFFACLSTQHTTSRKKGKYSRRTQLLLQISMVISTHFFNLLTSQFHQSPSNIHNSLGTKSSLNFNITQHIHKSKYQDKMPVRK